MHDFMEIFGDPDKIYALGGYLGNQLKVSFWREGGGWREGVGWADRWVGGGKTRQPDKLSSLQSLKFDGAVLEVWSQLGGRHRK